MEAIRIVAIPTEIAEEVRSTMKAPSYGFPAHKEVGEDAAPCRHCLRLIEPEQGGRILFTYDRFSGVESLPQPGRSTFTRKSARGMRRMEVFRRSCAAARARWKATRGAAA